MRSAGNENFGLTRRKGVGVERSGGGKSDLRSEKCRVKSRGAKKTGIRGSSGSKRLQRCAGLRDKRRDLKDERSKMRLIR
jgi:hypothetical protein